MGLLSRGEGFRPGPASPCLPRYPRKPRGSWRRSRAGVVAGGVLLTWAAGLVAAPVVVPLLVLPGDPRVSRTTTPAMRAITTAVAQQPGSAGSETAGTAAAPCRGRTAGSSPARSRRGQHRWGLSTRVPGRCRTPGRRRTESLTGTGRYRETGRERGMRAGRGRRAGARGRGRSGGRLGSLSRHWRMTGSSDGGTPATSGSPFMMRIMTAGTVSAPNAIRPVAAWKTIVTAQAKMSTAPVGRSPATARGRRRTGRRSARW